MKDTNHRLVTVLLCLLLGAGKAMSFTPDKIEFSHISTDDGLSQTTVFSCAQDSLGRMWFGTSDGLNCYNGYDFNIYRNNPSDSTSIAGNIIRKVYVDSQGRLWAGTAKGLSLYDTEKDSFRSLLTSDKAVTGIVEVSETKMMVVCAGEIKFFDTALWDFIDSETFHHVNVEATILHRDKDKVWIGTVSSGVLSWDIKENKTKKVAGLDNVRQVQCINYHKDTLWVATEGDGLWYAVPDKGTSGCFRHRNNDSGSISSNYVRTISSDTDGNLWVGTYNGLSIRYNGKFYNIECNPFTDGSLSQNSVRCIVRDRQGGMWLGTYFGGINYWHPLMNRFHSIRRKASGSSLNDNIVSCMAEDTDGTIWIGTNSGGVNHYNPEKGTFKVYSMSGQKDFVAESNDIKAIYISPDNCIYVGAHAGGLSAIDKKTGAITHFESTSPLGTPLNVYAIAPAGNSKLWIGTLEGIKLFDMKSKRFVDFDNSVFVQNAIKDILIDSEGRLWIGGENGVRVYRRAADGSMEVLKAGKGSVYADINVQCLFESSTGQVWAGTRTGLMSYNPRTDSVAVFTSRNGLPSEIIHSIEEDSFGRLWVSTDRGLSCMDTFSGKFRNFSSEDGLQSNYFNSGSSCRTSGGVMMFGGLSGITTFIPEEMEDNPFTPTPLLTGLKIFDTPVYPSDGSGILSKSITMTKKIVLKHNQNTISIDFAVTNYLSGKNNTFAYILEGYDPLWQYSNKRRSISWSNLKHGKYKFLVKAANNDGKWSEPTSLEIVIKPVWYQTIAAKCSYIMLIMMAFIFAYLSIIGKKNKEKAVELEKQEQAHQEDIQQMKMRFFINISHEMRTPLTLIINPLSEMIIRCNDTWMRNQLKYLERNAKRLLHLVNQLMDYRRAELGVFKLKVRQEDADRIIRENWSYYEKLAAKKKLKYTLTSDLEGKRVLVDGQYLELILNNLLSNAFKYTDSGSISLVARIDSGNLLLKISDTGTGIPEGKQGKIFERFYQIENEHIGSGIGLSLVHRLVELHHGKILLESQVGKGSEFTVLLPQSLKAYSDEEIGDNGEEDVHSINVKEMYIIDTDKEDVEDGINESSGQSSKKKGKVLIVEDNEEIRNYMCSGLGENFEIVTATDGLDALEKIKEGLPDVIVTDMIMPRLDGLKFCSSIKQDSASSAIPVIMISSKTEKKDQLDAFKAGADDYIAKPFSISVLNAKICNMLRTRARLVAKTTNSMEIAPEKLGLNAMDEHILNKAIDVVMQHLDKAEFSTEDFAREMGMSRSNLHLKLKALTGESALDFIRKIRFKEAVRLIEDGRYSISQISDKVGFTSASYFATSFKKYMGCLPTEWVREHRK